MFIMKKRPCLQLLTVMFAAIELSVQSGCATSTAIFFPSERAVKAVDSVIDEILGAPATVSSSPADLGKGSANSNAKQPAVVTGASAK